MADLAPSVVLIYELAPRPQQLQALLARLQRAYAQVAAEPGTLWWQAAQTLDSQVVIWAAFVDLDALARHQRGPWAAQLMADAPSLLVQAPRVRRLQAVPPPAAVF